MDEQFNIIYRNYGIADRFPDNEIEMNKHLKKWPDLHASLLQHEARHTNNEKFNKKDFVHDLSTPNQIKTWTMMKFIARHPFSLMQFVPVYYTKKRGLIVDFNLIIIWSIILFLVGCGLFIGNIL